MILQRVEQSEWLSNAYLIVDRPGGSGVLVDSNDVTDPLVERVELRAPRSPTSCSPIITSTT